MHFECLCGKVYRIETPERTRGPETLACACGRTLVVDWEGEARRIGQVISFTMPFGIVK